VRGEDALRRGRPADDVPRYSLVVAYDGTAYHGFQLQRPGLDTVAARLEAALAKISPEGERGERVVVTGASRTDAGVHAKGQVCAFSSRLTVPCDHLPLALNSHLPPDIVVLSARRAAPGFDPRGDAVSKTYRYYVWRSPLPSPFYRKWSLHFPFRLDLEACRAALEPLEGRHDFAAFRDTGSSAQTTTRTIHRASIESRPVPAWHPPGGEVLTFEVTGDGFLYHMVRIIVGTLLEVGQGRLPPDITLKALRSGVREELGPTAPAHGLWLERVSYKSPAGAETVPVRGETSAALLPGGVYLP